VNGRGAGRGRRRALRGLSGAALALLAAAAAGCVGDLFHVSVPQVEYAFTPPFTDTVLDVGDTSLALRCHLTANGRPVPCTLGISFSASGNLLALRDSTLMVVGYGSAAVRMRPLNVQLPVDTIERPGHIHAVVPVVAWGDNRGLVDTLAVGAMRLELALPTTRSGAMIAGAPLRWVQDSGQAVAHFVAGLQGWLIGDAPGVTIIRVASDTGSTPPRRVVVVPQRPSPPRERKAP